MIRTYKSVATLFLIAFFVLALSVKSTQAAEDFLSEGGAYPEKDEVLTSLLNPHEQINDEGNIIWSKCTICHPTMPNVKTARNIKSVDLYFAYDLKLLCYKCHPQRVHPGGEWVGRALGGERRMGAPNHLIVPPPKIARSMQMSLKETYTILPKEPGSGKIFCATCHNPHERGLLRGRADTGGDNRQRIRSTGMAVCQLCHRK
ncbi:MAG: hypothetical protein V3T30_05530 [Thermodesulfobacteriota bacterium]